MKHLFSLFFFVIVIPFWAQEYEFEIVKDLEASSVKSQGRTGTCWSFSTSSFLESEIYRLTEKKIDVSEMYLVRETYEKKAWNYVMRQGKTQLSEGGLAHDVINAVATGGIVPQSEFQDVFGNDKIYNHKGLVPQVKEILDAYIKNDKDSKFPNWKESIAPILDAKVGHKPKSFVYKGTTFTPLEFRDFLKIVPENYISLTSFTHEDYYKEFVLNIPDNFSNGSFYNLPLEELTHIARQAIMNGYSISLDVDVSEPTFSPKEGLAVLPNNSTQEDNGLTKIVEEVLVTPELRQYEFECYNTTDDHLMHITGLVKDQKGRYYFKVKNSWGSNSERVGNNGYIYMSMPYFKMKTISILLHKNALSLELQTKLKL